MKPAVARRVVYRNLGPIKVAHLMEGNELLGSRFGFSNAQAYRRLIAAVKRATINESTK